uniref:SH3 domain-containing protein n=1 Tax=Peronospora matthiolae TaxID=2874970 RepID=A0AAV1UJH5_9STRA
MDGNEHTLASAATLRPQYLNDDQVKHKDLHSDTRDVAVDMAGGMSPSRKCRRIERGENESDEGRNGSATIIQTQLQAKEEEDTVCGASMKQNGRVEDEKKVETATSKEVECVSESINLEDENGPTLRILLNQEVDYNGGRRVDVSEKTRAINTTDDVSSSEKADSPVLPLCSQAVPDFGRETLFAEGTMLTGSCPSQGDNSVKSMQVEPPPQGSNHTVETPPYTPIAAPASTPLTLNVPDATSDNAPVTLASYTADTLPTSTAINCIVGRRKRNRRKFSCFTSQRKAAVKSRRDNVPALSEFEEKSSVSASGHAAKDDIEVETDSNTSASPVYPDTDASHLYSSTQEGAAWQWKDADPYFNHPTQGDLDNLLRWGQENAAFVAANPQAWRGVPAFEQKRGILETMAANVSFVSTAHVEFPIHRGRRYLDVWKEADFLRQRERDNSAKEINLTSNAKSRGKRKRASFAEDSLLQSHRDLVYGYDDDLFREFSDRLACRVKACQFDLHPATPMSPLGTRRQNANMKVGGNATSVILDESGFNEEVLPSFPIRQLHPASLGLWKLRTNVAPDYTVIHPASVNRSQVPARWKEEKERHQQKQYELRFQQMDATADLGDENDKDGGVVTQDRHSATILNCAVTGELPSFGNCVEDDEISQAITASMKSLVSLSISNWSTIELVHERAAISIQCTRILDDETAVAQELENLFLQLCPPSDVAVGIDVLYGSRRPWASRIAGTPNDVIAYCARNDAADNRSFAVAASVEFALKLDVGDEVDVLDRNGCWKYGEVVETYSDCTFGVATLLLIRLSLCPEDTVEWIASSDGRILPRGVADGSRSCSVGPTRAHRVRVRFDQSLAKELKRSLPQRQAKQASIASQMLARRQHDTIVGTSNDLLKTPQKRKRKRPAKFRMW